MRLRFFSYGFAYIGNKLYLCGVELTTMYTAIKWNEYLSARRERHSESNIISYSEENTIYPKGSLSVSDSEGSLSVSDSEGGLSVSEESLLGKSTHCLDTESRHTEIGAAPHSEDKDTCSGSEITKCKEKLLRTDYRNEFESDFGRVIFSNAARRMHDKTQVFPLTNGDSVHTRLTHSMEVMSVATSLGISIVRNPQFVEAYPQDAIELERRIPAILKTAAFVHDIGNPPFGHCGEAIIQDFFKNKGAYLIEQLTPQQQLDFTQFDGNAQGFRILTKMPYLNDLYGLNLTYATLGAYLKYPNTGCKDKLGDVALHKHGVFTSEQTVLNHIAEHCRLYRADGSIKRHPLAFLVEAADTICYRVMDLEDGLQKHLITIEQTFDYLADKLHTTQKDIRERLHLEHKFAQPSTEEKMVVDLRVALMNYLIQVALQTFLTHIEEIDHGTFGSELLENDPICSALGKWEVEKIFRTGEIARAELTGETVLSGILERTTHLLIEKRDWHIGEVISSSMARLAEAEYQSAHPESAQRLDFLHIDRYWQLRLIVDWVAGMTDKYAVETYRLLL